MPVLQAYCCMAAIHGLRMPGRQERILIPHENHPPYPGNILTGQSNQRLFRVGLPSMYALLRQRRLRWLSHVGSMEDRRIPKDIIYGELALERRITGRPQLRCKYFCLRDMKAVDIDTMSCEGLAADRTKWRSALNNTSIQEKRN